MKHNSIAQLLEEAENRQLPLHELLCRKDLAESGLTAERSRETMRKLWAVMQDTSDQYRPTDRSNSGLTGGDAQKLHDAAQRGSLLGGRYFLEVMEEALKTAECNACMKRIVAAPTAGSCGVLPAVLLPLYRKNPSLEDVILDALYIAAGFGAVTAQRASVSGAEGGCQAEIGTASAMAAAALVHVCGGTDGQCAQAFAMAMGSLLGLVCDPVAGLVEVPCVKRNAAGAANAIVAANMALAGITSRIPVDEVIDAMGEIGEQMHPDLKETGIGGLAGTPAAQAITKNLMKSEGSAYT